MFFVCINRALFVRHSKLLGSSIQHWYRDWSSCWLQALPSMCIQQQTFYTQRFNSKIGCCMIIITRGNRFDDHSRVECVVLLRRLDTQHQVTSVGAKWCLCLLCYLSSSSYLSCLSWISSHVLKIIHQSKYFLLWLQISLCILWFNIQKIRVLYDISCSEKVEETSQLQSRRSFDQCIRFWESEQRVAKYKLFGRCVDCIPRIFQAHGCIRN